MVFFRRMLLGVGTILIGFGYANPREMGSCGGKQRGPVISGGCVFCGACYQVGRYHTDYLMKWRDKRRRLRRRKEKWGKQANKIRDNWRQLEAIRGDYRQLETIARGGIRGIQGQLGTISDESRQFETIRQNQRENQRELETFRYNQRPLETIRGNQRQLSTIRYYQRQLKTIKDN